MLLDKCIINWMTASLQLDYVHSSLLNIRYTSKALSIEGTIKIIAMGCTFK